jgi:predicted nucleotidyltransferase
MDIDGFRDEIVSQLGSNLICLLHHGSHIRGEARTDSDIDFTIVVSRVNKKILNYLRDIQYKYDRISIFLLEEEDLKTRPKATHLQFIYSKLLFGNFKFQKPSSEEIEAYVSMMKRDETDASRHYIIFPHNPDKLTSRIRLSLKYVYICLSYIVFKESGRLPKTRLETIQYFESKGTNINGIKLLDILNNWSTQEKIVYSNPDKYLYLLEKFWRELNP